MLWRTPAHEGSSIRVEGAESPQMGSVSAPAVRKGFPHQPEPHGGLAQEKEHRLLHEGPGCALPENHPYSGM